MEMRLEKKNSISFRKTSNCILYYRIGGKTSKCHSILGGGIFCNRKYLKSQDLPKFPERGGILYLKILKGPRSA